MNQVGKGLGRLTRIAKHEFENLRLNFSICAKRDVRGAKHL